MPGWRRANACGAPRKAKPRLLRAPWQLEGEALVEAKHDATLLALKDHSRPRPGARSGEA
jgi:hypothetical protein